MTLPTRIAIRADASPEIGVGHVMRCLVLADELSRCGIKSTFLCREVTTWAAEQVTKRGHNLLYLTPADNSEKADAKATYELCKDIGADVVVVDHYGLNTIWCAEMMHADVKLCAIDDLAEKKSPVGLLIDPGLGRKAEDYESLVPPSAICLTGAKYGLIRTEFAVLRDQKPSSKTENLHVLISMGGSDPLGYSLICLDALDALAGLDITVVLTSSAPYLDAIKTRINTMTIPSKLLVDHNDMAGLVASADLVLGSGGGSALERCVLGVPTLLAVMAPNQQTNADHLADIGAVELVKGMSPRPLSKQVEELINDPDRLSNIAAAAAASCDGRGGARVALELIKLHAATHMQLRPASTQDMEAVFDWQTTPNARQYARNPNPPNWKEHQLWFTDRLNRTTANPFYIIDAESKSQGFVRLDQVDETDNWEVSILLANSAQGKGLARAALAHLRLTHPKRHIAANVHPENASSQRLFEAAGYVRVAPDAFLSSGWDTARKLSKKDTTNAD